MREDQVIAHYIDSMKDNQEKAQLEKIVNLCKSQGVSDKEICATLGLTVGKPLPPPTFLKKAMQALPEIANQFPLVDIQFIEHVLYREAIKMDPTKHHVEIPMDGLMDISTMRAIDSFKLRKLCEDYLNQLKMHYMNLPSFLDDDQELALPDTEVNKLRDKVSVSRKRSAHLLLGQVPKKPREVGESIDAILKKQGSTLSSLFPNSSVQLVDDKSTKEEEEDCESQEDGEIFDSPKSKKNFNLGIFDPNTVAKAQLLVALTQQAKDKGLAFVKPADPSIIQSPPVPKASPVGGSSVASLADSHAPIHDTQRDKLNAHRQAAENNSMSQQPKQNNRLQVNPLGIQRHSQLMNQHSLQNNTLDANHQSTVHPNSSISSTNVAQFGDRQHQAQGLHYPNQASQFQSSIPSFSLNTSQAHLHVVNAAHGTSTSQPYSVNALDNRHVYLMNTAQSVNSAGLTSQTDQSTPKVENQPIYSISNVHRPETTLVTLPHTYLQPRQSFYPSASPSAPNPQAYSNQPSQMNLNPTHQSSPHRYQSAQQQLVHSAQQSQQQLGHSAQQQQPGHSSQQSQQHQAQQQLGHSSQQSQQHQAQQQLGHSSQQGQQGYPFMFQQPPPQQHIFHHAQVGQQSHQGQLPNANSHFGYNPLVPLHYHQPPLNTQPIGYTGYGQPLLYPSSSEPPKSSP